MPAEVGPHASLAVRNDQGTDRTRDQGSSHLRGVGDVTRFGARGDGVTDDTAPLQAAIDAGGITFFPPGDYVCGTLVMRKATRLMGANSGTYTYSGGAYREDFPTGTVSRLRRRAGTNAPLILGPIGARHVVIEDLNLDGNNPGQDDQQAPIVYLPDASETEDTQWVISRCYVHGRTDPHAAPWGSGGSNVYIGAARMACRVVNTVSNYANRHGFEINGSDTLLDSCIVGDNGADGVVIGAWATTVTACAIFGNTDGIHVADTGPGSPKRIILSHNGIDRNRQNGILIAGTRTSGAAGVSIANNAFTSNSTDAEGAAAHVSIRAAGGHVALSGNIFSVLEEGYGDRTAAAVHLENWATALELGNIYEGGSVEGFTNAPSALSTQTQPT
jgi:polygalacturonase